MRTLLAMLLPLSLLAQEAAPKKEAAPAPESQPAVAAAKQEESKAPLWAPAASPVPSLESNQILSGYIEVGARWVGEAGNIPTYRSIVNLGEGLRLNGMDLLLQPTNKQLFDYLRLQAYNWGGDPYNTARMEMFKRSKYRFLANYSNVAYYNYLPSFADPTINQGIYMNQRSYDTAIRNLDTQLELFPGTGITPYVGYSENTDHGSGITDMIVTGNQYPLNTNINWNQHNYFAGVRANYKWLHGTVEQGLTTFQDNQGVFSTQPVDGNRTVPYLGRTLYLNSGDMYYFTRGRGPYTKAFGTLSPWSWLDVTGNFLYSSPDTTSNFNQNQTGNLVTTVPSLIFYPAGFDTFFGNATMPRTSGAVSAEVRPMRGLRILESWGTDSYHNTTSGNYAQTIILTGGGAINGDTPSIGKLDVSNNVQQLEAVYDFGKRFTARGGWRYEWGQTTVNGSPFSTPGAYETANTKRNVVLAGVTARPVQKVAITFDMSIGRGDQTYYRTGLYNTERYRLQARATLPKSFFVNAVLTYFSNDNPTTGVNYHYRGEQLSGQLQWMPHGGKSISVLADYTYSDIRSQINYLYPVGYFPVESLYTEVANTGTLLADFRIPVTKHYSGRATFGGSFVMTAGSRWSNYYTPTGRILFPVTHKIDFFSEWRYYSLSQPQYTYEGFRSNMYMGGLRFLM
jgi:hypothetical protein